MNVARVENENNVAVYQFQGDIYYRTIKNIKPGCELLLSYAEEYVEELFRGKGGKGYMFIISSKIKARQSGVEEARYKVMELVHQTCGINNTGVYFRNEYYASINTYIQYV